MNNSQILELKKPLKLKSGKELKNVKIAYNTYGQLNAQKDNAILVCHALTGDQYLIGKHPITGKLGWWDNAVGAEKAIDTNKYFVICSNVIGSCMGSTGPQDINPDTNKPYGLDFPVITIADMVEAQKKLVDHLGVEKLFAVIGGSMGGMQVLEWAAHYPQSLNIAIAIATTSKHSAQNIAFHEIGRQAIIADPNWNKGDYYNSDTHPSKGLAVARMTAHVTYMSEESLQDKFGRNLQDRNNISYGFDADFQVESYLRYQGISFVDRFDANSYLFITRAMDYYDLEINHDRPLAKIYKDCNVKFCLISFSSDWLYPTSDSKHIARCLNATNNNVSFVEIETTKGHDAFLLDEPKFHKTLKGFIDNSV